MPRSTQTGADYVPAPIRVELERLNLPYHYDPQAAIDDLGLDSRIQVRSESNVADPHRVAEYVEHMRAGAMFPPIVVTVNRIRIDGNTRTAAALELGQHYLPAIVVDVDTDAPATTQQQLGLLLALGLTLNQQGGQRLDPGEVLHGIRGLLDQGWVTEQISRTLGVPPKTVTRARQHMAAETKAERVGLPLAGLSDAQLRALGQQAALNDGPWEALATLARDAGLGVREMGGLAAAAREAGSDAAALTILASERDARADQITERRNTGHARPPMPLQLRMRLGFIAAHEAAEFVEHNPDQAGDHAEKVREAITTLERVLTLQDAG